MSYSKHTTSVLKHLGYEPLTDYVCIEKDGVVSIAEWNHTDPQLTEQDILDNLLPAKRAQLKARIQKEADRRVSASEGRLEAKLQKILEGLYLLSLQVDGSITAGQQTKLDAFKAKALQLIQLRIKEKQQQDAADALAEQEVDDYDETDNTHWQ